MTQFSKSELLNTLRKGLRLSTLPPQITSAFELAYRAHDGQFRDQVDPGSAKIPYIAHPVGVALIASGLLPQMSLHDTFEDIMSACLLHDVLEDTETTSSELTAATSTRTCEIVLALTKPSTADGLNHKKRNAILLQNIVFAGPTAMFVKLCDHCHNIGRPNSTPVDLLEKAIAKGRNDYLPAFFNAGGLPAAIRTFYESKLEAAQQHLDRARLVAARKHGGWTLERAIAYCVDRSDKKVIESHDLISIIETITSARFVRLEPVEPFLDRELYGSSFIDQKIKVKIRLDIQSGELQTDKLPASARNTLDDNVSRIYFVDVSTGIKASPTTQMIVGVDRELTPSWVDKTSLRLLVGFLTQRLAAQRRNQRAALAADLVQLRLPIDLDAAELLQLTNRDLVAMRETLDGAEYIKSRLLLQLGSTIRSATSSADLPTLTARVKEPASIARKMIERKYHALHQLDDILGLRVVCRSRKQVGRVQKLVRGVITKEFRSHNADAPTIDQSIREGVSESSAGYNSVHMYFTIDWNGATPKRIACEVQLRTLFQDAWARLSHDLTYKNSKRSPRATETLKELARLRDDADLLLDDLE